MGPSVRPHSSIISLGGAANVRYLVSTIPTEPSSGILFSTPSPVPRRLKKAPPRATLSPKGERATNFSRRSCNLRRGCLECLFDVRDDVFDILQANREPDVVLRHARLKLFRQRQLLVRRAGGVDDQGLGISYVGQVG